jgi:hypothetical protein
LLTVYKEFIRHAEIYDYTTSSICFSKINNMLSGEPEIKITTLQTTERVEFQITATPQVYEFCYRLGSEGSWAKMGSVDAFEFSGYDFTGMMFGIFASAKHEEAGAEIAF